MDLSTVGSWGLWIWEELGHLLLSMCRAQAERGEMDNHCRAQISSGQAGETGVDGQPTPGVQEATSPKFQGQLERGREPWWHCRECCCLAGPIAVGLCFPLYAGAGGGESRV